MRLFRRRTAGEGRHALGAAVTAIPSVVAPVVPVPAAPLPAAPTPAMPVPVSATPVQALVGTPPPRRLPSRSAVQAAAPGPAAAPRVQLGFRDGSCTDLDPSSAQSRALRDLADALTRSR